MSWWGSLEVKYVLNVSSVCRAGMFDLGEAYPEAHPLNTLLLYINFTLHEAYPEGCPRSRPPKHMSNIPAWERQKLQN